VDADAVDGVDEGELDGDFPELGHEFDVIDVALYEGDVRVGVAVQERNGRGKGGAGRDGNHCDHQKEPAPEGIHRGAI